MLLLSILAFFVIALVISFIGSVQLGPVNLVVINRSINNSFKEAMWIGFGGAIPEIFYSAAAFYFSDIIVKYKSLSDGIQWAMIPIFIGIGIYLLLVKPSLKANNSTAKTSVFGPFFIGLGLGTLNPMLLPFWIVVIQYCIGFGLNPHLSIYFEIAFILGAFAGALLLQFTLAYSIHRTKEKFEKVFIKYANPVTGIAFLLIAIIQIFIKIS